MPSSNNGLFASSRTARSLGLFVAAAILFMATVGGSSALYGAYTVAVEQNTVAVVQAAI